MIVRLGLILWFGDRSESCVGSIGLSGVFDGFGSLGETRYVEAIERVDAADEVF